jgi:RNA polymerase sigma factor (sigma-70 family)
VYAACSANETRIEHALPAVQKLARIFARRSAVDRDDLVSVGNEAVVRAHLSFDPDRGSDFGAHAWTRVRYAMLEHVRREAIRRRRERERGLIVELDADQAPAVLGVAETVTTDREGVERMFEARDLLRRVARLPGRERDVLVRKLRGEEHAEIAQALGISSSRAWQLRAQAVYRLRETA